ncbi:C3HC zinc finger-like-domain-containing protein [Pseudomassariella vexata]|uniref:C3HC zinc finger-like-domain-containing protein n=1 Tax=Pseudomassariella vexata TaxID=1141098 RepID=A0A1Y2DQ24_9PEZI|nr:C3HC zinc finger-like-domain-containing protein [Pseudomassariella vexata]ORY61388.1 C3HC zinc finger-like-domain-containing protein [Pseudomassariella vexata]
MNATKRKFNALIQGIGTRSSPQAPDGGHENITRTTSRDAVLESPSLNRTQAETTNSTTPTRPNDKSPIPMSSITSDFLSKRRRVAALGSTTGNESPLGSTNISDVVLKKTTTATPSKDAKVAPPRYCPGDRDQLIRRLGTFQELTEWTPKPDKVNEIEWAKRGWVCQGKERVRCTLCSKELVVKTSKRNVDGKEVPVTVGSDFEQALVKKFAELMVEAHEDDCPWRRRGCDDSLLRLVLTSPSTALPSLRQRYDELCARPAFLPYQFNLRLPPSFSLQAVKAQLPPNFFTEPTPSTSSSATPNDVALALALTGWQGLNNPRIGPVPNSAACATCLRRLGLWMFKSKEVDPETNEILVPAPMDHLDPVREHRFFCPWRNAGAQRNSGSHASEKEDKTAWEVLAVTIRNASHLRGQTDRSGTPSKGVHGRSKSTIVPGKGANAVMSSPTTPGREDGRLVMLGPDMVEDEEDENVKEVKDKERWARLRRVKSLFNTKNGKRLQRSLSRPGTASNRPDTAKSTATGSET